MPFFPNWLRPTDNRDYELGIRAFDQGLYEEAIDHLWRCLETGPDAATTRLARFYLGESYSHMGQAALRSGAIERSADLLRKALEQHPSYADLHFNLALVQRKLGERAEAMASVTRALSINPSFARAIVLQGLLWFEGGRANDGIERIRSADGCEHIASDRIESGMAAFATGDHDAALSHFESALVQPGEDTLVHVRMAEEALASGDYTTAAAGYRRALQDTPNYADLQCKCGLALLGLDRCPEAAEHFEKALTLNSNYLDARYGLARAYLASGMVTDARDALQTVLETDPGHMGARQLLDGLAA